jgi:heat shock protein HtpX
LRRAQDDCHANRKQGSTLSVYLTYLISVPVLLSPLLCLLAGLLVISIDFPNLFICLLGALLFATAWVLTPKRPRLATMGLTPLSDMPALSALVLRISDKLCAPPVIYVRIEPHFNASVMQVGIKRHSILSIGAPLWASLTAEQRVAMLAHELAHLVSGDPARGAVTAYALEILQRWNFLLTPNDEHHDAGAATSLVRAGLAFIRMCLEATEQILLWLMFNQSQRAEYFADASAVSVAGTQPNLELLRKLSLADLMTPVLARMAPTNDDRGVQAIENLAYAIANPEQETANRLLDTMREEQSSTGATHPPTVYRMMFVDSLAKESKPISVSEAEMNVIDAELRPHMEQAGLEILRMRSFQ